MSSSFIGSSLHPPTYPIVVGRKKSRLRGYPFSQQLEDDERSCEQETMMNNNKQAICNPDLCFSDNSNSFPPPRSPNVVGKKRARPVNSSSSHNFRKKPKTQVSQAQSPVNLDDSQIEAKSMECGD